MFLLANTFCIKLIRIFFLVKRIILFSIQNFLCDLWETLRICYVINGLFVFKPIPYMAYATFYTIPQFVESMMYQLEYYIANNELGSFIYNINYIIV